MTKKPFDENPIHPLKRGGPQLGNYWNGENPKMEFQDIFSIDTISFATCEKCGNNLPIKNGMKEVICSKCGWILNFERYIKAYEAGEKYDNK